MTLKEKLSAKEAELKGLEAQIKDGEEEAVTKGEELTQGIEELRELIKKAEKAQEVINGMTINEEKNEEYKGLEDLKREKGSRSFALKAYNDPEVTTTIGVYDRAVVTPPAGTYVRDIFGSESISGNALTYYVLGDLEGAFTTVAEGAAKPQVHVPYTPVTKALVKIAGFMKETDELLTDAAFLESAIRGRGVFEFRKAVDEYLVDTLSGTSGVQTGEATITFDNLLKARQDVRSGSGYSADTILINPADLEALLLAKDSNNQYLLGGPAFGSYGNGGYTENPRIWGMNVVESGAVNSGQAIVGAFRAGASVVTQAGQGLRVEVSNSDQNDFIYNRVTVRIEERLLLAVRVPGAFVKVGTASSSS